MPGKLNNAAVDTLIKSESKNDIDFMLYISGICNEFGSVRDLSCKDVCDKFGIDASTFYRIIVRLADKGLIYANGNREWGLFNITIINNIFMTKEQCKSGYLNINRDFLLSEEFRESSLKKKRLVLRLLKTANLSCFKVGLRTIGEWLKVSNKAVIGLMDSIKTWFNVDLRDKFYYISLKPKFDRSTYSSGDMEMRYRFSALFQKYSITCSSRDLKDLIELFHQYGKNKLQKLIMAVVTSTNQHKTVQPKLINYIVSNRKPQGIVLDGLSIST